ncbi:uncharacterized protein CXQ87_003102 [Candidozyma duobushaemuli]|uniref:chitinase n=2 Tax=Candidozyma TaxID=3303203 RepID=A0ABX8I7P2_9ASCO|nr:uncharacterized protein CXQ87_003102 [[Candida] duobushaemulonis]PVH15264.1 hypothetical protein CXQ87_003102 [[Candida] duobushaemulonis]QWU88508.1 hypothetical protein CA3LBN_002816 [[Candida] haemuloni]
MRNNSESSNQSIVSGIYFSNWSVYGAKHFPSALDSKNLSHVFYAFMKIDGSSGEVTYSDEWADVQMPIDNKEGALGSFAAIKKDNRELKLLMSIGGWGTSAQFTQIASDEAKLSKFVESSVALVEKHNLDGVDIDWEYPTNAQEGRQLVNLLQRLRKKLDKLHGGLLLTIASPASEDHSQYIDFPATDKLVNYWNVMAYDFAGSGWSQKTGYHSNLYGDNGDTSLNVDQIVSYYASRVDSKKIILGMPLYGRTFSKPAEPKVGVEFSKEASGDGTLNYGEINANDENFDKDRVAAYAYSKSENLLVTYDNQQSASAKADYVKDRKLGGGFWWDSKGESKDKDRKLVGKFVDALGGSGVLDKSKNWV